MDPMQFPDQALAVLREARYDAEASRGFHDPAGGFLWSDERMHRVRQSCADHGSRAHTCVLAYRASLIRGQPIEEYRPAWEHLRLECPDWPGFRPDRRDPGLARAMAWESRLRRLLPGPGPFLVAVVIAICLFPLMFALPAGVHLVVHSLQGPFHAPAFWGGLGLQLAGIAFCEFSRWLADAVGQIEDKWRDDGTHGQSTVERFLMTAGLSLAMQLLTLLPLSVVMDGGVRFRACCLTYLLYAVPALVVLAVRWNAWTRLELLLLRWAWAPIIAFGLPLLLPAWQALGWVRTIS
jgi:hypothetical protein